MRGWVIAGAAMALAATAGAQPRVQDGRLTPGPARAVVTEAVAGDAACYLTLRDQAGRSETWEAAFEACEAAGSRIGQVFALEWGLGTILHPDCQGDVNCGRSLRIMLVQKAVPLAR